MPKNNEASQRTLLPSNARVGNWRTCHKRNEAIYPHSSISEQPRRVHTCSYATVKRTSLWPSSGGVPLSLTGKNIPLPFTRSASQLRLNRRRAWGEGRVECLAFWWNATNGGQNNLSFLVLCLNATALKCSSARLVSWHSCCAVV